MNLRRILPEHSKISRRLLNGYKMEKLKFLKISKSKFLEVTTYQIQHFVVGERNIFLVFLQRFSNGLKGFGTFDGRIGFSL